MNCEEIKFDYFPYRLYFKYPFKIASTERVFTNNVYVLATSGNTYGWGESVFIPYYDETYEMFQWMMKNLSKPSENFSIKKYIQSLKSKFPKHQFSIASIDIALHNLDANITGTSIHNYYQINGSPSSSSYTIGMGTDEMMERKFNENSNQEYYKLKVNQDAIDSIVKKFTSLTDKPFTIDANQGFTDRNKALKWTYKLADLGVAYFEQPFIKDDYDSHHWLKARSPIPIIADESFQNYDDLEKIIKCFNGINMKLMKCGGISEGVEILKRSKEMDLKSIIGCMSESSVVANASMEIAALADWVDVDGPLLISNDPFAIPKSNEEIIEVLKLNKFN